MLFAINVDFGAGILSKKYPIIDFYIERGDFAVIVYLSLTDSNDLSFLRFFFGRVRNDNASLALLLAHLFFEVLAVQNIPLPASRRHVARERLNFLAHDLVETILPLKKLVQDLFRLHKRATLVGEINQATFPQPVHNEMGQMGHP